MTTKPRVLGLGSSLTAHSTSRLALELALEGALSKGAETRRLDLRSLNLPLYEPELQDPPASTQKLALAVREADALI